ncbi:MAG: formylglycine-generating enzyme family protein [Jaaginema sp. PMC 1079.18]|nr:formylglycine-generating enzyme family protein [Jaaginema sp. PMC 1080.18]MEC4853268.1 formylglycine-generating enzyme family protein [Jaaginema sp. PMC 1079.18]MEC4867642.1 formylglycine-generating enzyme family protein [Jaaginema sp. PMC 1078.18]
MSPITLDPDPKEKEAQRQIQAFVNRFGKAHLIYAYHAAFPLTLTPGLAYRLWETFDRDIQRRPLDIPWVAVSDLLLSEGLCREVDNELYEMDVVVRRLLLRWCEADANFGPKRLRQLSKFLLRYLEQQLRQPRPVIASVAPTLRWIGLAYLHPEDASQEIASTLQQLDWRHKPEVVRLASLLSTFADPLAQYQPLLQFGEAMAQYGRGNQEGMEAVLNRLGESIDLGGVRLDRPRFFDFETVTVNRRGEIIERQSQTARYYREDLGKGVSLEMVYIPGGSFMMGAPEGEKGSDDDERPQHQVTVQPFFMGKCAITQAQWRAVAALPKLQRDLDPDPSRFKGDNRPVEKVNWYDAVEFCARLSVATGRQYILPSEAQWEYACRANTKTPFHFGETITTEIANYDGSRTYADEPKGEDRSETTPAPSSFPANSFGLYDMHGNVWEWCADPWHSNYNGAPTDGKVWDEECNDNRYQNYAEYLNSMLKNKSKRIIRGGSWIRLPGHCRSAYRHYNNPDARDYFNNYYGFRVMCVGSEDS